MKNQSIEEMVRRLARKHFTLERGIERFVWLSNGDKEEIHLIEINHNTIPEGAVRPFYLRPNQERPWPVWLSDITPEEWEKVKSGLLPLPEGWSLDDMKVFERDEILQAVASHS